MDGSAAVAGAGCVLAAVGSVALLAERMQVNRAGKGWRWLAWGMIVLGLSLVLRQPDGAPSYLEQARVARVKADVTMLTKAVDAFKQTRGAYPDTLQALAYPPDGGKPFLEPEALVGPWGPYAYDRSGPQNQGKQPDVWAVAPSGELVGNWPPKK